MIRNDTIYVEKTNILPVNARCACAAKNKEGTAPSFRYFFLLFKFLKHFFEKCRQHIYKYLVFFTDVFLHVYRILPLIRHFNIYWKKIKWLALFTITIFNTTPPLSLIHLSSAAFLCCLQTTCNKAECTLKLKSTYDMIWSNGYSRAG